MKNYLFVFLILVGFSAFSQNKKKEVIEIKTSAKCEDCKDRIEKSLAFEKGVKDVKINLETAVVSVTFIPEKTNPEALRKAISLAGYDADEIKADTKAYQALPLCCQKGH